MTAWVGKEARSARVRVVALVGATTTAVAVAMLAALPISASAAPTPGGILAWGADYGGELGLGSAPTLEQDTPLPVDLPAGVVATHVVGGSYYGMALSSTGVVYTWGQDNAGQLGQGSSRQSTATPAPLQGIPAGVRITTIAPDMALGSNGVVYTWGDDSFGQLGQGAYGPPGSVAMPVIGLPVGTTFTALAAAPSFDLALTSTGKVYAWGENNFGELGNGLTGNDHEMSGMPSLVTGFPAGTAVTQISAGDDGTMAVTSTGALYEWGLTSNNAEGYPSSNPVPQQVSGFPAGTKFVSASAGHLADLALTTTGSVYAWGRGVEGELGDGSYDASSTPRRVVGFPAGTVITQIGMADETALALSSTGGVYAWGDGTEGALGDGARPNGSSREYSNVAVPVSGLAPSSMVRQISTGGAQAFALSPSASSPPPASSGPTGAPSGPGGGQPVSAAAPSMSPAVLATAAGGAAAGKVVTRCKVPKVSASESTAAIGRALASAHCTLAHGLDAPASYPRTSGHKRYRTVGLATMTVHSHRVHGRIVTVRTYHRVSAGSTLTAKTGLVPVLGLT